MSAMLYAYMLDNINRGIEAGKELAAFYGSAPPYLALFSSLGYDRESKAMVAAWKEKDRERVKATVPVEMVKSLTVLGSTQDLRDRITEYFKVGIDDVFICPTPFGDYEANLREILAKYCPT
jgi:alkanesulfonate monooxygenase SsuD/methylene tetrahydromethanopterin reductase-like flavin-dependent oxidoreductase (luciferase family)